MISKFYLSGDNRIIIAIMIGAPRLKSERIQLIGVNVIFGIIRVELFGDFSERFLCFSLVGIAWRAQKVGYRKKEDYADDTQVEKNTTLADFFLHLIEFISVRGSSHNSTVAADIRIQFPQIGGESLLKGASTDRLL